MAKPKKPAPKSHDIDTPVELPDLQEQYDQLQNEYHKLVADNSRLQAQLDELLSIPVQPVKKMEGIPPDTFTVAGAAYRFAGASLILPKIGKMTALEMLVDEETYSALGGLTIKAYLVKTGSKIVAPA